MHDERGGISSNKHIFLFVDFFMLWGKRILFFYFGGPLSSLYARVKRIFSRPSFYCARTSNFHVKESQYWNAKFGYTRVSCKLLCANWLPLLEKLSSPQIFRYFVFRYSDTSFTFQWIERNIFRRKSDENVLDPITEL